MSSTPTPTTEELLTQAEAAHISDPKRAEAIYAQILENASASKTEVKSLCVSRTALIKLGEFTVISMLDEYNAQGVADVINKSRAFMSSTAKARPQNSLSCIVGRSSTSSDPYLTAETSRYKFCRPTSLGQQEKRIFLKHSLETRLIGLQLDALQYKPALTLIDSLLTELKRLDDKMILTEVHLLESRVYRGIGNFPKAKAALTSSRTAANSIYCPPHLQAQLDLQSGVLHAEDKDYTTAYSYFFETFENLSSVDDPAALGALKYMLLCKVMLNLSEDVNSLLSIKLAAKYAQLRDVESMRAIARAHQDRNLADFEKALRDYREELSSDTTIRTHLSALYDTLLEQNLLRIVEPYSVVEVEYVAEQVKQGRQAVEQKLSQMILDKVFHGVLDQQRGILLVFDEPEADNAYGTAIETLAEVGNVVDSLYAKTVKIV
ncbi:PCI-domain-containing protein [Irpex lacteus]|nr:PCI-domain-containing protein [Irpex lacteus]